MATKMTLEESRIITAVLLTLDEQEYMIETMLYLAVGCDLRKCQDILGRMELAGTVKVDRQHRVRITPEGRRWAKAVRQILAKPAVA